MTSRKTNVNKFVCFFFSPCVLVINYKFAIKTSCLRSAHYSDLFFCDYLMRSWFGMNQPDL